MGITFNRLRPRLVALTTGLAILAGALIASDTSVASPSRGCAYDRPCIDDAYYTTARNIYVTWTATESFSHYNVIWSRPGRAPAQVEVSGGRSGSFRIRNIRSWTTYTISVQGCNKSFLGSSRCSPWESTEVRVRSF